MENLNCQKCGKEMPTNSYICTSCERSLRNKDVSKKKHNYLVTVQNDREITTEEFGNSESSAYWKHQEAHGLRDEDGHILENAYANPDVLAEESNEVVLDGEGKPQFSRCVFCNGKVFLRKRDGGVKKYVHDAGCWDVFKGEMLRESAI